MGQMHKCRTCGDQVANPGFPGLRGGRGGPELKDGAREASARSPVLLLNSRSAHTGVAWTGSQSCQLDRLT